MWNTKEGLGETVRSVACSVMSVKYLGTDVDYVNGQKSPGFRRMVRSRKGKFPVVLIELIQDH